MNGKPEIKELENGKVGYFYSPQQLEVIALVRYIDNYIGKGCHPLDNSVKGDNCRKTYVRKLAE